jgi:hypothetical protein
MILHGLLQRQLYFFSMQMMFVPVRKHAWTSMAYHGDRFGVFYM